MELRPLGKTGLKITPIGLGCWQFSQGRGFIGKVWSTLDAATIDAVVKAALDGGINWFDTAESYGYGKSEEALAGALTRLGKKPGDVIVATKWFPLLRSASSIIDTLPERLGFLDPFPIDLLQIHSPGSLSSVEKQAMALAKLLKEQKVRAVGVSNFSAVIMRKFHKVLSGEGFMLASNQVRYSLTQRKIETNGILDTARELGITIIAYSPLAQGVLTGRFHDDPTLALKVSRGRRMMSGINRAGLRKTEPLVRYLQETGRKHSAAGVAATATQVALNWLVNFNGETVVAIPGASKAKQASEAAHCLDFTLRPEEVKEIDRLSRF